MTRSLAIVNGRLLGVDGGTALRLEDGRIAAVGGRNVADGATEVIDARGGLVMPGFDDAHIHLRSGARQLGDAQLFGLATTAAIVDAIRAHAAATPASPWVLGRGWTYAAFPGGLPTRAQLDATVPDRPAYMGCYDGHTGWANSAALALAGIDRTTPDPPNGRIERDGGGEPTGVLKEEAQSLVERRIPEPTEAEDRAAIRAAIAGLHRAGITAGQDAEVDLDELGLVAPDPRGGRAAAPRPAGAGHGPAADPRRSGATASTPIGRRPSRSGAASGWTPASSRDSSTG